MNMDAIKMLTMIATANSQYSRAMAHLSEARANCSELVPRIDNHKSGMASVGGMINVRNAIAVAGRRVEVLDKGGNRFIHVQVIRSSNMARHIASRWVTLIGILRGLQAIFKTENWVVI